MYLCEIVLASLACARCFGELLWDATFYSNFGEQALGNNSGEQFCGFTAVLTNNYFEERQLWGAALASNFGQLLSATTLGGSFSSFGEQLFGVALDNNFGERLWGAALWNNFREQLRQLCT